MNEKPEEADINALIEALIAMRDSLLKTSIALQDLHYAIEAGNQSSMDETKRSLLKISSK